MAGLQESSGLRAARLVLAVAVTAMALASTAAHAADASPYSRITAWQMDKLAGTEYSTHPIVKKGEDYYLIRRIQSGEIFERQVQAYCEAAGLDAEKCKEVAASAQEQHDVVHWHKNFQVGDEIYLRVPREVYQTKSPER